VISPSVYIDNFTREASHHKDEGNTQKYAILEAMQHIVDNQS